MFLKSLLIVAWNQAPFNDETLGNEVTIKVRYHDGNYEFKGLGVVLIALESLHKENDKLRDLYY